MITLSAQEAFRAYEAVRHRLPPANPASAPARQIDTLDDVAAEFDVFLLDAFGVLNIGERAIPGVKDRIDGLRAAGKRVLVVSNAASAPRAQLRQKYARLGYDFDEDDIVTSRAALSVSIDELVGTTWGVMHDTRLGPMADFAALSHHPLEDDPEPYRKVDGFLLMGSGTWSEARQDLLKTALLEKPRPLVVANPDIVAPRDTGFSAEPGYFAHRLADETGVTPRFVGKPFQNIYDLAFARLGDVDRSRVLMVGDSLHTDILGAHTAGVASALVAEYGFFANEDVSAAIQACGIVPTYVTRRP